MKTVERWLGNHPVVVEVGIIAICALLIAAMYFHYDLTWIPDILKRMVGL